MINRRHLLGSALAAPIFGIGIAAAQSATPEATVVSPAPTTVDVLPDWLAARESLSVLGNTVADAFFAADIAPIVAVADPMVNVALANSSVVQQIMDMFVTNQIRFHFAAVNAWFYGQVTPTAITGHMIQGAAYVLQAVPEDPQTGDVPTGVWRGIIAPSLLDLEFLLEFSGTADALSVNLSVPAQMILRQPMDAVTLTADVPIGEKLDERSMPVGGEIIANNLWSAEYEWGGHSLVIDSAWDTEMRLAGLTLSPSPPPADQDQLPAITGHLPFDGAWLVFWGGDTTFANYHAATAPQRHALDIVIWKDGATCTGNGREPEEYWCFGQPLLAPVAGTVVHVEDGFEDIQPQTAANINDHPAGNHIVVETEGGFIYLAHCQRGSIRVAAGDTVAAGDVVALVGNSGNTSEPHIHIHAQSVAEFYDPTAVGVPLVFADLLVNGEPVAETQLLHGTIVETAP